MSVKSSNNAKFFRLITSFMYVLRVSCYLINERKMATVAKILLLDSKKSKFLLPECFYDNFRMQPRIVY